MSDIEQLYIASNMSNAFKILHFSTWYTYMCKVINIKKL